MHARTHTFGFSLSFLVLKTEQHSNLNQTHKEGFLYNSVWEKKQTQKDVMHSPTV